MNKDKYWVEEVCDLPGDNSGFFKAILSCEDHGACVEIIGTKHKLTERLIAILNGLNKEVV